MGSEAGRTGEGGYLPPDIVDCLHLKIVVSGHHTAPVEPMSLLGVVDNTTQSCDLVM